MERIRRSGGALLLGKLPLVLVHHRCIFLVYLVDMVIYSASQVFEIVSPIYVVQCSLVCLMVIVFYKFT